MLELAAAAGDDAGQPLGTLSAAQLQKGKAVLKRLEAAVGAGGSPAALAELSSEFYTLIPHKVGRSKPATIATVKMVQEKMATLTFLLRMGFDIESGTEVRAPISGLLSRPLPATLKAACQGLDIEEEDISEAVHELPPPAPRGALPLAAPGQDRLARHPGERRLAGRRPADHLVGFLELH